MMKENEKKRINTKWNSGGHTDIARRIATKTFTMWHSNRFIFQMRTISNSDGGKKAIEINMPSKWNSFSLYVCYNWNDKLTYRHKHCLELIYVSWMDTFVVNLQRFLLIRLSRSTNDVDENSRNIFW